MYVSLKRNLAREVREAVDKELEAAGDTFIAGVVASRVVARLRQDDPELLAKFLDQHAEPIFTRMVGDITRAQRSHARAVSSRSVFAGALERYESGETEALGAWLDTIYVVTLGQQRKHLRDMDQEDLVYAARDYTDRAKSNASQAAFLRALADRVGARTVGEVFTDEELSRMWNSLA